MRIFMIMVLLISLGVNAPALSDNKVVAPSVDLERLATFGSTRAEDEFSAIGYDDKGNMWVCWLAYDGTSDVVLAAQHDGTKNSPPITLSEEAGDHWRVAMCRDGEGRLWATWAKNENGNWDLWAKFLAKGQWSKVIRLTQRAGNDFCQKLAVDRAGTLWMVWQSVVDGNYDALLAPVTPAGLGELQNVSHHPAGDWEPAIVAARDGRVYVAWDSYRNGSYDILVTEMKEGKLGEPMGIATSPAYEAHVALAVDPQNRLWVAWDNGGMDWGKHNRNDQRLHSERSVAIRCLADGRLFEPVEGLSAVLRGPLADFCELPELIVDGNGKLWLFVRHLTDLTPKPKPGKRHAQARGIWNPYALCYAGDHWSQPKPLPKSNGRNDMRVATCLDPKGQVWATWADDGRKPTHAEEPGNHNVHAAMVSMRDTGSCSPLVRPLDQSPAIVSTKGAVPEGLPRYTVNAGGKTYRLLYGDTHRHTDISRCVMNTDGSLMDTYRYAMDVAKLDFVAISDHDQDILKHRYKRHKSLLQHYAWWRSEKYCDLFYIEGKFIPLYAYEHGGTFKRRGGHKNVLYLERGYPCYEEDSPEKLFSALGGKEVLVIPHQLADGSAATDWSKWDPRFERIAEIYQPRRGSYEYLGAQPAIRAKQSREGHYYWDALAKGVRIGVIASSDHIAVCGAYAGVYCSEISRRGIMEGMRSRRTFGSMDPIVIDFQLGERLLGEEVEVEAPPAFRVFVQGVTLLRKVQIVKNGQFVYTATPERPTYGFQYVDRDLEPGQQAYYYVRCEYEDERYGWSSPIWVQRKP